MIVCTMCYSGFKDIHICAGIEKVAESMKNSIPKVEWDYEGIHYFDNGPLSVQYLFVLDALNFCFWPGNPSTTFFFTIHLLALLLCLPSLFYITCPF